MILAGQLILDPHTQPVYGWLRVEEGRIVDLQQGSPPAKAVIDDQRMLICPGFVDAHVHLPQFTSMGCDGLDLLDWLEQVIFPAEATWADQTIADSQAMGAHEQLLAAGTLGYAGYLSPHAHSVDAYRRACERIPLRAVAGQVLMDRNAPADLTACVMVSDPEPLGERAQISVNPRFAVGCTDELLRAAADAANADRRIIQTHLAESLTECASVRELFPDEPHYAAVYDSRGLLTERTLLAHCVHLTDDQWRIIAERDAVVVHCPSANTFLRAGLFDLQAARAHCVRLALGSDVAAGPDVAMPRVARAMIEVAKIRAMKREGNTPIPTPAEAWDLITRGNAQAMGWIDSGHLAIGASADLLVIRPPFEIDAHYIGRLIYSWRDEYITHRVLAGRMME